MASQALKGLIRSLRVYHGDPARQARMDALYRQFVAPGDLVFDIGAHVGDRVSAFRRLGARVVALEPQVLVFRALQVIHGRDSDVRLKRLACGSKPGPVQFHVNTDNPTVSTGSSAFIKASKDAAEWRDQVWTERTTVDCTTFDELISLHGKPDFAKIDVEGFEADVLAGLTVPVEALSFEVTMIQRDIALACLDRLSNLGNYRFTLSLGESHAFETETFIDASDMASLILRLPPSANSGDVYARLTD